MNKRINVPKVHVPKAHMGGLTVSTFLVAMVFLATNTHAIDLDLQGGELDTNTKEPLEAAFFDEVQLPDNVEKDYYNFTGWIDEKGNEVTEVKHLLQDETLTATYEPKTYTISYFDNDELFSTSKYQYTVGATELLAYADIENHPYETFAGWVDSNGIEVTSVSTTVHGDIGLYANYVGNTYSIEYEVGDGTLPEDAVTEYVYGIGLEELPTPALKGYTFKGWYSDSELSSQVSRIEADAHDNMKLYAKWEKAVTRSYSSKSNATNKATGGSWSCGLGSIGAIKVGSYQAQLNYVDYGSGSMQAIVDASNSCLYTYVNSITYIADHASQGFSAILNNNTMQIMWSDGSVSTYYKRATYYTGTDGYTEYGHIFDIESGICTQTCVGSGYVFVLWS